MKLKELASLKKYKFRTNVRLPEGDIATELCIIKANHEKYGVGICTIKTDEKHLYIFYLGVDEAEGKYGNASAQLALFAAKELDKEVIILSSVVSLV